MTYLTVEQLSKNFGLKPLFQNLTFGLSKGDKTALVAPNGTGKSTLLNVLAGTETPDGGKVTIRNGIRIGMLEQEPGLDDRMTIHEYIRRSHSEIVQIISRYEKSVQKQEEQYNDKTHAEFEKALTAMNAAGAWDYQQRMEQILSKLNIHDLDQSIASLSGGEKKRVALAFVLLDDPDLLLLDEPTNHLDVEMIEWLENYLAKSTLTLLMVTHDRYFLDRVCNRIIELDAGNLYHHNGNYGYYLQKKAERKESEQKDTDKAGQLLKKELEWLRRAPKARTTKSKSRISAVKVTEEKARQKTDDHLDSLEMNMTRMGSKVLELKGVHKRFDNTVILNDFSYSFQRGERIGIIGRNGSGKSTFLNIINGEETIDSGTIDKGSTIVVGHYRQQGIPIHEDQRVIDVLKDVAEVIELANGKKITASRFLEQFMFPAKMQYTPVAKLSGGERRRLGLMMVLLKNPNFLILDEPTNDLDLMTMNRLEEFLIDFGGCLIIVSHDRFFMDKLVQHYFIFEGDGKIRDFNGSYEEYRKQLSVTTNANTAGKTNVNKRNGSKQQSPDASAPVQNKKGAVSKNKASHTRNKLSFREHKLINKLEQEIDELEKEKAQLETDLSSGELDQKQLQTASERYGKIQNIIDEKTNSWLELAEKES